MQVLDAQGVARDGSLESLDALLDREGDIELHVPRPLHETPGHTKIVILVDGGPEQRLAQRDIHG